MQKNILIAIVGIMIGAFGTYMLLPKNLVTQSTQQLQTTQNATRNSDVLDAHFIEQMIPHHQDAITMAKIAQTKAKRPEVKELANNIITAQTQEITEMKTWYRNWFGKEVANDSNVMSEHGMMGNNGSMHMGMMGTDNDLDKLQSAQDFDKEFVQEMIPHHQMAVMMASMLKNGTQREEMKKLADNIINSQSAEIDLMRGWLVEWSK